MNFGIPNEIMADEHRVGLTPTGVVQLVKAGHCVFCEQNCCSSAGYSDGEYREAGAQIVYSAEETYGRADVVLKIKSPRPEEYDYLKEGQILAAFSHLFLSPISLLTTYVEKKMTVLSYEEMVENGQAPVLMPASEIGGLMMPQIASRYMETEAGGRGKLLTGTASVPSATVSIIGAGVLGYHAARSFHRLGAHVLILDRNVRRLQQMEEAFGKLYGSNFRETIFEYSESYEANLVEEVKKEAKSMFKIVTIDNGWGVPEFCRIVRRIDGATSKVIMRKGISRIEAEPDIEIVDYDESLVSVLDADVALFTRVGAVNRDEFKRLMDAGIPCVVNAGYHQGLIEHEKSGFVYGVDDWAVHWLRALEGSEELRRTISNAAKGVSQVIEVPIEKASELRMEDVNGEAAPSALSPEPDDPPKKASHDLVTVITPTWKRHPEIVRRSIDCLRLQTHQNWQQIICSDGVEESTIKALVEGIGDSRVSYRFTGVSTNQGDFGNTVRRMMLERAEGDFVLFFDDDNVILPSYLEEMVWAIQRDKVDFSICQIMHFGPLNEAVLGQKPPIVLQGDPVKLYHIDPLQVLVRRAAMQDIGWDVDHGYISDGYTLERLGDKYKETRVDAVLGVHM